MARAIVTYGRSWQALAIVRSLGQQGIEVFVGEEAPFAPCFFSKYCTGSFQHPSFNEEPEAFLDFMEKKVQELKPDDGEPYVLIPVHKETWLYAQHRARFEPHIKMALTTVENMKTTHDKGKLADLATELNIRIPPTDQYRSLEEVQAAAPSLEYPVFLKLREGAAGVGLKKCKSATELVESFEEFVEGYELDPEHYPLVQGFVDGEDYCFTALFDHGRSIATMTYRNVRTFPRETGAGSLRESVPLPEAEADAVRLLEHLKWHGIAQLDFRKADDGPAHLIELNPRFFGGLPQAVAANVDYPHLLFRIAAGESVDPSTDVDYSARTEAPVTGLLATLDEIARNPERMEKLRGMRDEWGKLVHSDVLTADLGPFWDSFKDVANPKDIHAFLTEQLSKHDGTINDVLQGDDPGPALGVLYPIAVMLKTGKVSMGALTGETELEEKKPRRRLRDMLRRPTWRVVGVAAVLYGLSIFLMNWELTRNNIGILLAWPARLAEQVFGRTMDAATPLGALKQTAYHLMNLAFLYLAAALWLRESRTLHDRDETVEA